MTVPQKRGRTLRIVLALVVLVAIVATVATLRQVPQSPLYAGPRTYTRTLVKGQINLGTSYYASNFTVPDGATQIRLMIDVTAQGGSGNDIKLHILTNDNFLRWRNGQPYVAVYETGQITTFNQTFNLPSPDSYSVVYDNSFSFFSSKTVTTTATLTYLA